MTLIQRYGLPAVRADGSAWELELAALAAWKREMDYGPTTAESDLALKMFERRLIEAGPGRIVSGDINQLSKRLFTDAPTLLSWTRRDGCPLKKCEGNQWEVDLNAWELWRLQNHLGPYTQTGRGSRAVIWN
jgi:hypothetical protein